MQTVAIHVADHDQHEEAEDADGDQDVDTDIISKVDVCTHSTNASDDFAHRGMKLLQVMGSVHAHGENKIALSSAFCSASCTTVGHWKPSIVGTLMLWRTTSCA